MAFTSQCIAVVAATHADARPVGSGMAGSEVPVTDGGYSQRPDSKHQVPGAPRQRPSGSATAGGIPNTAPASM